MQLKLPFLALSFPHAQKIFLPLKGAKLKSLKNWKLFKIKWQWPNISANDTDPGSGSKMLCLNWDNFFTLFFRIIWKETFRTAKRLWLCVRFRDWILIMYVLIMNISVSHFLGEQLSHGKFYKNLVDCVLSHTIPKISCKNSV